MGLSVAQELALAHGEDGLIEKLGGMDALAAFLGEWENVARPEQLEPPGEWDIWLILAGRGFGKTRTGAETVQDWVEDQRCKRLTLVARTAAEARDVMVEGESGILAVSRACGFPAKYEPSKCRLTWPNGAMAKTFSAEEPDSLRGWQGDGGWFDELAAWDDPQSAWDQAQFGMRLSRHPRVIVTTTPRPIPIIREWIKRWINGDPSIAATKGSTFDNSANLAPSFLRAVERAYAETRLGRQELFAELLDDNPNALWKQAVIDKWRVRVHPDLRRIVVAVDPAVTAKEDSNLTGIVPAGIAPCWAFPSCKGDTHAFVLDDESGIYTPTEWGERAIKVYRRLKADKVVAEVNNGGDLVESNLRAIDKTVSYEAVHASRGKIIRAEPAANLYEQGKVHHVGTHAKLEDQLTQWNPLDGMKSPDRLDALVWALTKLMIRSGRIAGGAPQQPTGTSSSLYGSSEN